MEKEKSEILLSTNLPIGQRHSGKVRDIYDLGNYLLAVVTDRISAFDVIMLQGILHKGYVLNKLSVLWLKFLSGIIPNHFITDDVSQYPAICQPYAELLNGRSMIVKKAKPLPVECIVRGYLSGSAWGSYQKNGTVCGISLPPGFKESDKLPALIFTPSTKAEQGFHDENISFTRLAKIVGFDIAHQLQAASLRLYLNASATAERAGIIIADTKLEFGLDDDENLLLIDEVLTPDSSRFWPADDYQPGGPQPSFDKQFLRDYLTSLGWNQEPPPPELPEEILEKTSKKYLEAYARLLKVL